MSRWATPEDMLDEIAALRRDIERLTKALEEREADMHLRIRRGYDKTVADCWRAKVAEVERERDAAYAASLRSDEVHAEAMRAVRGRAEKAEAQVAAHLESLETYEDRIHEIADDALGYQDPAAASIVLLDALERDYHRQRIARIQAEAQVERLRGALERMIATDLRCGPAHASALRDARAALADAPTAESSRQRLISALRRGWPCVLPGGDVYGPYLDALHMLADALEDGEDAALADAAGEENSQ